MKARVRMYRQGLGDCFLVTFFTGPQPVHMLIDCGTLGTKNDVSMADVVADIAAATNGHLHLLVVTHEHKDHVSGFASQRDAFDDDFEVDHVWVAWTENPKDDLAKEITKFEDDLMTASGLAAQALVSSQAPDEGERAGLRGVGVGVLALLDFHGDVTLGADKFAETVHEPMTYAAMRSGQLPEFLKPSELVEPDWLPGVRFYVLGPPRNLNTMKNMGTHESPELYHVSAQLVADLGTHVRFRMSERSFADYRAGLDADERQAFERGMPFDPRFRMEAADAEARGKHLEAYDDPEQAWRRIDDDWLTAGGELALQLNSFTNNTSLVLAIELVEDRRVLLFPADAQLGNWLSWHDLKWTVTEDGTERVLTAEDLLARTVLYKVGHHASHNATVQEKGLELMRRDDLVAMIPVDRKVALAKRPHPWHMPATALYKRLLEKTRGRVLRSDTGWPRKNQRPSSVPQGEWDEARQSPDISVEDLYVEFRVE